MLSFLVGSPAPSWYDLKDIFEDYRSVAVYVDDKGNIEMIKVSSLDDCFLQTSVLVNPAYLKKLKPYYIKLPNFVAFPIFSLKILRKMIEMKYWRAIEYYSGNEFIGGWVLYDCKNCEEKQMLHLQVTANNDEELYLKHLSIYNS
ncbi:hypothetical protein D1867_08310 [Acidianus infernus]|uniref:Uncharacterized protein n=1 Tax=Acidianus infernus TaxID=12915 RepID=A0A6A9QPW0_ACIIN|nr:hypothetical protein [Acidianus infernus]MCY0874485.1 hypothetical protein [Acidianus infernus]MCY0882629.1 hypothetical protein [Acidianus infernus]MUM65237.1 hypothetical protein [Acidianus infernus]